MERLHAYCTFPLILLYQIYSNPIQEIIFLIYGLIVCIIILYQGQHYWKLKLHSLLSKTIKQEHALAFFRKSKKFNIILIAGMPLFLGIQLSLQKWSFITNEMLYWGMLANVFGILEYINYYHYQLMIDNKYDLQYVIRNRRLKKASLAKDLIENNV